MFNFTKTLLLLMAAGLLARSIFGASMDKAIGIAVWQFIVLAPVFLVVDVVSAWRVRRSDSYRTPSPRPIVIDG